jgi:aminoglycoside 6-adenylyltransferase
MKNMDDDVINSLITWGKSQARVRAVLLTSSRAGSGAPVDILSDYDPILYVTDTAPFVDDEGWLQDFGDILVMFRDQRDEYGMRQYARLVLYDGGTKIDFTIAPVGMLEKVLEEPALPDYLDIGYRVLLDKDQLTARMPPPSYRAHIPSKPTEQAFRKLVEEFWWDSTYVAKHLWRHELFPAKYMLEQVLKLNHLVPMLEWSIEIAHDWSLRPGKEGRWLKPRLPTAVWSALEDTFVGAAVEDNWEALFRTAEVFRATALDVARNLGYEYPREADAKVSAYLRKIRALGPA